MDNIINRIYITCLYCVLFFSIFFLFFFVCLLLFYLYRARRVYWHFCITVVLTQCIYVLITFYFIAYFCRFFSSFFICCCRSFQTTENVISIWLRINVNHKSVFYHNNAYRFMLIFNIYTDTQL